MRTLTVRMRSDKSVTSNSGVANRSRVSGAQYTIILRGHLHFYSNSLKSGSGVTQGHEKWHRSTDRTRVAISVP